MGDGGAQEVVCEDLLQVLHDALLSDRPVALATVVETWGSAPVPVGGQMVVVDAETFSGSVSGGCVENEVIVRALDVIETGKPQELSFGVDDDAAWAVGLPCGGRITVFVERYVPTSDLVHTEAMVSARRDRRDLVVTTVVRDGARVVQALDGKAGGTVAAVVDRAEKGLTGEGSGGRVFRHVVRPPTRVVIFGATHIAQVLTRLAMATGYHCVVVDPREAYANEARFPGVELVVAWPDEAVERLGGLDSYSAVVTLAHVPEIDDPALLAAVGSDAIYIGALGSRRNHARRRGRLVDGGMTAEGFGQIRCPVGLDIGAATPPEIALSVMAEVVLAVRGAKRLEQAA